MHSIYRIAILSSLLLLATAAVAFDLVRLPGSKSTQDSGGNIYYTCPMHPSVVSENPGDCPICGMSLVKKERDEHNHQTTPESQVGVYTCPMHPSVVSDKPGDCPICGMSLVPRSGDRATISETDTGELSDVILSPRQRVLANVATSIAEIRSIEKRISTVGRFDINEQKAAHVAAWIGGRVERLHVDFTGIEVRRGQPLLDIYSPLLIQTQEEYLTTLPTEGDAESSLMRKARERLRDATRQRLLLWGITLSQIEELESRKTVTTTTTIYSPASGTVLQKMVHEGMYIQQGQILFDIADLSSIWMYADVYEHELSFLKTGQQVVVYSNAHPDREFRGTVTFIDPVMNPKTRSLSVRAVFPNSDGSLKPKMFGRAEIRVPLTGRLVIPASAVINTGERQVVWEEVEPNRFIPRHVTLGSRVDDWYEILEGLQPQAVIASSGGFLLDSESQLKAMAGAAGGGGMQHDHSGEPPIP